MSTASARGTTITYTGDVSATLTHEAATNLASPAVVAFQNLASGPNTVTVVSGGATAVSVTIIPPAGNVNSITLKGISGDTGISLHLTDPTTIALASSVTSFVLTAGAAITGVRLIWS